MNIDKIKGPVSFRRIHSHIMQKQVGDIDVVHPSLIPWASAEPMSFHSYRRKVWRLTNAVAHQLEGIEKRGWDDHHVDHIFSIYAGWLSGRPIEEIADIANLRIIPKEQNLRKGPFGK